MILDQIHNCALHGGMKRLYMECKTIELLLNQLHESSRKSIPHGQLRLRPYDVDRIHEARRIILEKIDSPPSLMELARQVGINTTKLKQGFQQVFKSTVYGAIRQERLRLAHGLLMEGRLSITEIGQQLGFSDASHFIREFSKHYGTTPGRLAKSRHK
ncbi:hypothetical protein AAU61_10825 [Desulfocarbo indianensis]|nr:hypothetical protein AAU61_10825 [Desulfocarbo indianensis]